MPVLNAVSRSVNPLLIASVAFLLISCGGSSPASPDDGNDGGGGAANQAPSVDITSPSDGHSVLEGETIDFAGSASDPEDGDLAASIVWTSDADGALGTGSTVSASLSNGMHSVTAAVTDQDGEATASSITVTVDAAPSVTIDTPEDGAIVDAGASLTLTGSASDPEDGDLSESIEWGSDLDGALGSGASVTANLSEGEHELTASISDSRGQTASASVSVSVTGASGTVPIVAITSPSDGSTFAAGETVTLSGNASDPEDGDLSDQIAWSSSVDGSLGTGSSISTTLRARSGVSHDISASVTDGDGNSSTATITLVPDDPPTVTISQPANGASVAEGESLTFEGSASDPEDGDLSASIVWHSDLEGALGTGTSLSTTLVAGSHVVTASVTDSKGQTAIDEISVTVGSSGASVCRDLDTTHPQGDTPTFTPFTVAPELTNTQEVVDAIDANYPADLRDAGIGGTVAFWFFIEADGSVPKIQISESSGYDSLDAAGCEVAKVMEFDPALNSGEAVAVWISLPITFEP
ncbi:MAG: TonB family protein [Halobacteriales archaeon]|nr:TonB family protein [Halobacteriales archaeon]